MAATTTTTTSTTSNTKPKRRRFREITISSSASSSPSPDPYYSYPNTHHHHDFHPDPLTHYLNLTLSPHSHSHSHSQSPTPMAAGFSSPTSSFHSESHPATYPSSFSKFNSALTAGLLNPMSPPLPQARSSPTLFEMMANEPDCHPSRSPNGSVSVSVSNSTPTNNNNNNNIKSPPSGLGVDKQGLMQQRIDEILGNKSPGNQFNDPHSGDIKLMVSSKDGFSVNLSVHRQILVAHSRFFAGKLAKQQRSSGNGSPLVVVEIADCEDVEVYVETLRLMYCKDLRRKLMKEDVPKVLGILKVSAAIGFDAGVLSCLEYLEAAPWAEDEEEKVASLLSELHLEGIGANEVLKRVFLDATAVTEEHINENEEVLLKLLHVVLEGRDEKARRDMKGLVSKMLRESANQNDLRKDSLYSACDDCLRQLRTCFLRAASSNLHDVGQIARQADNLHWILDILIDRQIAEDFLKTWASQSEMSEIHSKVPPIHRFEISRVTARLFVGIGNGQLLASKDMRCLLLQTWLVPFYDDFGWMRRASKGLDRHLIEDGLSNTILTLPLAWQQDILLAWFDRFLNSGEDCPNIQRAFEVWWRRAFWRRSGPQLDHPRVRIANVISDNS